MTTIWQKFHELAERYSPRTKRVSRRFNVSANGADAARIAALEVTLGQIIQTLPQTIRDVLKTTPPSPPPADHPSRPESQ